MKSFIEEKKRLETMYGTSSDKWSRAETKLMADFYKTWCLRFHTMLALMHKRIGDGR